jgi:uncharacterized protein
MNLPRQPNLEGRLAARQLDRCRPQVMAHRWESLLFLHWRVSPDLIQKTLPDGLLVDTFAGDAWIGVIPFFMRNVRVLGTPGWLRFPDFLELNVRTYVHDASGTPGVWFYSLDCNQPLAVRGARRLSGLNYCHAQMSAQTNEYITYHCRRMGTRIRATYIYRGNGPARESSPDSLEFFLLERYYLFARRGRTLVRAQVSHPPYQFRQATVSSYSALPAIWDGLTLAENLPDHQCYVDGLDARIYATMKLSRPPS